MSSPLTWTFYGLVFVGILHFLIKHYLLYLKPQTSQDRHASPRKRMHLRSKEPKDYTLLEEEEYITHDTMDHMDHMDHMEGVHDIHNSHDTRTSTRALQNTKDELLEYAKYYEEHTKRVRDQSQESQENLGKWSSFFELQEGERAVSTHDAHAQTPLYAEPSAPASSILGESYA